MSNDTNTGGPAFPFPSDCANGEPGELGMTLRQYAAIKLKVPDSGTDWLDEMINKSLLDDFAAKAMQGLLSDSEVLGTPEEFAIRAFNMADAMIQARNQ